MKRQATMHALKRSPKRPVAARLKRRLQRLAKQDHEPSANAARSVLAGDPHVHYPAFVSKPYIRDNRVRLSKPTHIGWYYVLPGDGPNAAAICVGHGDAHRHPPMSVQSAAFTGILAEAIHTVAKSRGRLERPYSLAVIHIPELMLLLLWIREGSRSKYLILEPSHPNAPRGVVVTTRVLESLASRIYRRLSKQARLPDLIRTNQPEQP